jgi:regulator of sigma E protease
MEYAKTALYFIAVLSVLVVVHEWGHFIVAKMCRMRVEDFSLFFGKKIVCLGVRNGTEYNIRSIPLGGFVRIAGMEPDDISNGTPIFKAVGRFSKYEPRLLRGLDPAALANIDFDQLSDRVVEAVSRSIEDDGLLSASGRADLTALKLSATITDDDARYIDAVLSADAFKPDPDAYNQKPLWQRAAVIFAGPFMSIFFGFLLLCLMGSTIGLPFPKLESTVAKVTLGKPADKAGIKPGDVITDIDGRHITSGETMVDLIHNSIGKPLHVDLNRDGEHVAVTVVPEAQELDVVDHGKLAHEKIGLIGIEPKWDQGWKLYSAGESIRQGTLFVLSYIDSTLHMIFSKQVRNHISGIVGISQQIHSDSQQGPRSVIWTSALLSISLGILNLFPIPILDGGHLMLLAVEGIRRRKLSSREVYTAQMVGISIIGVLFVLVMYNDISRLIIRH